MKRKLLIGGLGAIAGAVALRKARQGEAPAQEPVAPPPPVGPHPLDPAAERERAWQAFEASPCPECGQAAGVVERTGTRPEPRVSEGGGGTWACRRCGAERQPPA